MSRSIQTNETSLLTIDLNCDLGEGIGNDALIMPHISSANIACGYHAGDADTMKSTVELAIKYGVAIGAHPSYLDRANFGRTDFQLSPPEVYDLVTDQVNKLATITRSFGATLHHVKPHGALYNKAASTPGLAAVIALAAKDVSDGLVIYGSRALVTEAKKIGMKAAHEGFADRRYNADGSLVSRKAPGALIDEEEQAIQQVLMMIKEGKVKAINEELLDIKVDTVCIHGDAPGAVRLAEAIRQSLKTNRVKVSPPGTPSQK